MKRDYATTFATAAAVIVSYLLVLRIIAAHLGTTGFGEYTLARRTLSVLSPLALLGTDLAIARFVAYAAGKHSARVRSYPPAGLALAGLAVVLVSSFLLIFQGFFAALLFGTARYVTIIVVLPLLLTGTALHATAYAYLRGRLQIIRANLLMILNQVLVPLAVVGLVSHSVPSILLAIGLSWTAVSLAFLAFMPMSLTNVGGRMNEVARYGIPRVPGDFLQLALFTAPGILVAHIAGIGAAGIVAFGVAALGIVGSALSPINFIMLPVASRLAAQGSVVQLRRQIFNTHRLTIVGLVIGTIAVEILAQSIIRLYLGPEFVPATAVLRVIIIGALPWGLYVTLKSIIDARHVRAFNTRNMLIAVVSFSLAAGGLGRVWPSSTSVVVSFVFSLYVLGILTIRQVYLTTRDGQDVQPNVADADISSAIQGV